MRFAAEDIELHGHTIRRGDAVSLVLAAAHRDPAAFACPHQLEIERTENRHLGFGLGVICHGLPVSVTIAAAHHSTAARSCVTLDA